MSQGEIALYTVAGFLLIQDVRGLLIANTQGTESAVGKTSVWFTTVMMLIAIGFILGLGGSYPRGILAAMSIGAMVSGILMIYDSFNNPNLPEKNRLWFGITYLVMSLILVAMTVASSGPPVNIRPS